MADEIIELVEKTRTKAKSCKAKSVLRAIRAVWNEDKIAGLLRSLDYLRAELVLRILVSLNTKLQAQNVQVDDQLAHLDSRGKEVVEIISINQQRTQAHIGHVHGTIEANAKWRHDETVAAILTLRDGETRTITRDGE